MLKLALKTLNKEKIYKRWMMIKIKAKCKKNIIKNNVNNEIVQILVFIAKLRINNFEKYYSVIYDKIFKTYKRKS